MSDRHVNITGGFVADKVDEVHKAAELKQKEYTDQAVAEYKKAFSHLKAGVRARTTLEAGKEVGLVAAHGLAGAASLVASVGVGAVNSWAKLNFQTANLDMLRFGDSYYERNGLGIAKDVLRALNFLPVLGRAGAAIKECAMVTQEAGTVVCSLVTLNNALAETGQGFLRGRNFFLNIREVARNLGLLAKIEELGAFPQDINKLAGALKGVGVALEEIPKPLAQLGEGVGALEDVARAHSNGIIAFGVEGPGFRHIMSARNVRGKGIVFLDTDGKTLQGMAEFAQKFPGARLSNAPILFMKNTMLVEAFKSPILNVFFPAAFWSFELALPKLSSVSAPLGNALLDRGPVGNA